MNDRDFDLEKHQFAEASRTGVTAELSEAELSQVSGGGAASHASVSLFQACCNGKHISTGKITT